MCYSAMVEADLRKLEHQGINDVRGFVLLYQMYEEMRWSTPRGLDANFMDPREDWQREIKGYIDTRRAHQETKWQEELFKQRKRLADAERILATKPTKKAAEDK